MQQYGTISFDYYCAAYENICSHDYRLCRFNDTSIPLFSNYKKCLKIASHSNIKLFLTVQFKNEKIYKREDFSPAKLDYKIGFRLRARKRYPFYKLNCYICSFYVT